jgi:4-hydroxybenzoate polyprenyltransferase
MKRILLMGAGVVGVLVGLGFIMPAVALWRQGGTDTLRVILPLFLGVALMAGALLALLKGASRTRA